jgi:ACT domain-containing protein
VRLDVLASRAHLKLCADRAAHLGTTMQTKSNRIIVTVIGVDTVGIIAKVSAVLAEANANIVDISQTTLREFFTMIMMADLDKATVPFDELKRKLNAKGDEMGLRIDAQHEDVFKFMHRV